MRILYITAGAAQMYCGSCLRDNALATELLARGHDVVLVPLYTPTLTDEQNVSGERVFFGGISVYLEQHSALFRRTPRLLDRLWDSKLALKLAARSSLQTSPRMLGELTVSMLKGEEGNQRKEFEKLLDWLRTEPPFDIISLPYTLLIGLAKPLGEALGRPVCCTLQGEDLFLEGLPEPYRSESLRLIRESVPHVSRFLAVSRYYEEFMPGYLGIPSEKMRLVPLGISLQGFESRAPRVEGAPFKVGYFARVAPEKGLHLLAEAYIKMRGSLRAGEARLEVAGYLGEEHTGISRRRRAAAARGGARLRVCVPRRARPRGEDRVPARPRRALRARDLRRAEGDLPARSDGVRRARRPAAPGRVHRGRRADRRRPARRAGRRRGAGRRAAPREG